MPRLIVIGGGVIGLSIGYEMSGRGWQVSIIDVAEVGRSASWAGAGILTPANTTTAIHPLQKLEARSIDLHQMWSVQLQNETGVDNGLCQCGAIYVARTAGDRAALVGSVQHWQEYQIRHEWLDSNSLFEKVPALSTELMALDKELGAVFLPDEYQIRNPDHLAALTLANQKRGVELIEHAEQVRLKLKNNRIERVEFTANNEMRQIRGDQFCIASGAWSGRVAGQIGISLPMVPVRGQMVLFKLDKQQFSAVTYEGARYVVPRNDGHVLAGATVEEVGFDVATTEAELAELRRFASSLYPALSKSAYVKGWAGLRPATFDGFPYIGRLPGLENGLVATGHFRSGLHLSTGTAEVICDLVEEKRPRIDLAPFDPGRIDSANPVDAGPE